MSIANAMLAKLETAVLVFGIILIVFAVFLIIAVLMQQGKSHNLSGAIAGGADTFFGKTKGQTISKKLSVLTSVVAIIFVIIVLAFYVQQIDNPDKGNPNADTTAAAAENTTAGDDTTAEAAEGEVSEAIEEAEGEVSEAVSEAEDEVSEAVDEVSEAVDEITDEAAQN